MQGNKGGAALALSLMRLLGDRIDNLNMVFSVPAGSEWIHEANAAQRYQLEVIENIDGFKSFLPPFCFKPDRLRRTIRWCGQLLEADVLLQMSAISYVGPPHGGRKTRDSLGGRFFDFVVAGVTRTPFIAWTQSYGPFSNRIVRFLAKLDLGCQTPIFCRGERTAEAVLELLPAAEVEIYPDVAVSLEWDRREGLDLIKEFGIGDGRKVATISPSSVMYSTSGGLGLENEHVATLAEAVNCLRDKNYAVILVPHTLRKINPKLTTCDLEVAKTIVAAAGSDNLHIISDDLLVGELKSIIAACDIHIGARYHSVVAALSSGTPAISLSWHLKYYDLMQMYDSLEYLCSGQNIRELTNRLIDQYAKQKNVIETAHRRVVREVLANVDSVVKRIGERG